MMSRSLIRREIHRDGILYAAEDAAGAFLANLQADYIIQLRDRAEWVSSTFDGLSADELDVVVKRLFEAWTTEFQPVQFGPQAELL